MQIPLRISAHHIELPASTESLIRKRAAGLERFCPQLVACDIVVEGPGGHHRTGGPHDVRLRLSVPGDELVIDRQGSTDLLAVIHDAFDAATRRLQDHARLRRHQVKHHEELPHGWVVQLFPDDGYGFLATREGREIYFHRNSVLPPGFDQLAIGSQVAFCEEQGHEGPQACTVSLAE